MRILTASTTGRGTLMREAARLLRRRQVIIFPTDTIYGLLGDASRERVLRKIFAIKKRARGKPFPILVPSIGAARRYANIFPDIAARLKKYWPGPVTAILTYRRGLAPSAVSPDGAVALRFPKAPLIRELLARAKRPLAATSVNISGRPYENGPERIKRLFAQRMPAPAYFFDFGKLPRRKPSQIVDLRGTTPRVVRK